jgi:hypothetical protein
MFSQAIEKSPFSKSQTVKLMKLLLRRVEASLFSGWLASGIQPLLFEKRDYFLALLKPLR